MMDKFILRAQLLAVLPNGVVLHASSVAANSRAFVFLAKSGGGKSTIMGNLIEKGKFGAIGDDSVVIATGTDGIIRSLPCGSMKQSVGTDKIHGAPVRSIYFVEKGEPMCKISVTPAYAFYRSFRISSIMAYSEICTKNQNHVKLFLKHLFKKVPTYILRYDMDHEAAKLL